MGNRSVRERIVAIRDGFRLVQEDVGRSDTWPRYNLMSIVIAVGGIVLGALDGSFPIVVLALLMLVLSVRKFRQKLRT